MRKLTLITIIIFSGILVSQNAFSRHKCEDKDSIEVAFLQEKPIIDGFQDDRILKLPYRKFDSKFNFHFFKGSLNSQYKLAYGTNFLYVYIEAEADSLVCKDRGYQNGDGFILAITKPKPNNEPADEFYILGFSSQKEQEQMWAEKIIWYYNIEVQLAKLSDNVEFVYKEKNGKISFELVLPWEEIYPYHPLISEGIGFNLWFLKAFPNKSIPNMQGVLWDMKIGSEQSLRKYKLLKFEKPLINKGYQTYALLDKNHCQQGGIVKLKMALLSTDQLKIDIPIRISNTEGEEIFDTIFFSNHQKGENILTFDINTTPLQTGGLYSETIRSKE